jgi:DUF1680 family protein
VTDVLRPPAPGAVRLKGYWAEKIEIGVENHLKKLHYPALVDYFRVRPNPFAEGEFWGKTVRSACLSYQYRPDPKLKEILDQTVADLLSTQTPDGCISACTYDHQPKSSDLWERKYVLLGLLHYYEIDPRPEVLQAMVREADYTISQVGPSPKTRIVDTGWAFAGIESSSILEPMMKLYDLTGEACYLEFARYIVEQEGGCKRGSIFEAAFHGVAPKDINGNGNPKESIAKAYEEMSCFEGLIEYFRATGHEHWKEAALTFYRNVRDQEITIIGSGGGDKPYNLGPGTGEQWNNLAVEQTNPDMTRMMETCVTVTWMKLCYQLLRLTGDPTIADEIEKSIYNALAGAQKLTGNYYDYYQKLNGHRGSEIGFGAEIDGFPLSCCTANGPMGMALIPFFAVMESNQGPVVNLYSPGSATLKTPGGAKLVLETETVYPKSGSVVIDITTDAKSSESFTIALRIPQWSRETKLSINGQAESVRPGTYARLSRPWKTGDKIELVLDLKAHVVPAPHGVNPAGHSFEAIIYGPLALSRDRRLGGDIRQPVRIKTDKEGIVSLAPFPNKIGQVGFIVPTTDGGSFPVIDYASAGNTWDEASEFVTWIPKAG